MPTTRDDIRGWLAEGKRQGATHMIVVCDTFDHGDFPVYVMPGETPRAVFAERYGPPHQEWYRAMECYAYALDLDAQLAEHRARHWD